jgi:hypothetical protein
MQKKPLTKIQHAFMMKALKKLEIERMFLNTLKSIYDKLRANILLNGEQLKSFPIKSRTRQGCLLSPLLFNIVLEFLNQNNKKEKK